MTKAKLDLRCEGWAEHNQSSGILSNVIAINHKIMKILYDIGLKKEKYHSTIHRYFVPIHVPSRGCAVTSYDHLDFWIQYFAASF